MKVTRRNVFETNSSSTHSITIVGGEYKPNRLYVDPEDSICRIPSGEFGWEEERYHDTETKASYCLTWCKQTGNADELAMLKEVIEREIGNTVEFIHECCGTHEWGYIDHQSCEVFGDGPAEGAGAEAFQSPETLRDFIFNPDSELVIDNDNH